MAKKKTPHHAGSDKTFQFESLEDRLVLSADAAVDLPVVEGDSSQPTGQFSADDIAISQTSVTLSEVNQQTGVSDIHQDYGFDGAGQTVVVIDSGIAWDHYALGGGYGEGHRVVGGWDFAENDADPFDDGGAGFHGTHVSGIIGSSDSVHQGVASGVDLVSLRVFDDAGNGNLEWVEQALRWVEQNIDSFESPITTVNLSIGTNWNANNLPEWATLEEEFAALESRGIFISVAAGNNFEADPTVGVSYPAVSDHVVPVSSHGEDGQMSDFSQRNQNVLVAPGEDIMSAVPGHLLGQSTSQSFLGSSGTSMAAPYVAGSSVLVRQAMNFMGYEDITQQEIYDRLSATADDIFDSITGANYKKINVRSAIESIITDRYGESAQNATDIGTLNGGEVLKGTIGTFQDKDVIQFTAGKTGMMTFQVDETHQLDLLIQSLGPEAQVDGNRVSFLVQEGESYQIKLSTESGIGHYSIDTSIEQIHVSTDLGSVDHFSYSGQLSGGQQAYEFTASQNGLLVVQWAPEAGTGGASFTVTDSNNQVVGVSSFDGTKYTLQIIVAAGEKFQLNVAAEGDGKLDVQNLVSLESGQLKVSGTDVSNQVTVSDGQQLAVSIDGVEYQFQRTEVSTIFVDGKGGEDQVVFSGQEGAKNTVWMKADAFYASGTGYQLTAVGFQEAIFRGQSEDVANLYDTSGTETFTSTSTQSSLVGESFRNVVYGAGTVFATSSGGSDRAVVHGSEGDDYLYSAEDLTYLKRTDGLLAARGFDNLKFDLGAGLDEAHIIGSWGDDSAITTSDQVQITSSDSNRTFKGLEKRYLFGNGGNDSITFNSTSEVDTLYAWHDSAYMQSGTTINYAKGFGTFVANGDSQDRGYLFDSAGDDSLTFRKGQAIFSGDGFRNEVNGFGKVDAYYSSGGEDRVVFEYGAGETFQNNGSLAAISGDGFQYVAHGFANVEQSFVTNLQQESLTQSSIGSVVASKDAANVNQQGQDGESRQESQRQESQRQDDANDFFAGLGSGQDDLLGLEESEKSQKQGDQQGHQLGHHSHQQSLLATDRYFEESVKGGRQG